MPAVELPNTSIKSGYAPLEDDWGAEVNRNFRVLDILSQLRVIDKDLTAPPGSPAANTAYIVGPSATGAWAGQDGKIAIWQSGSDISDWTYITPKEGWRAWVDDENVYYQFGTSWVRDDTSDVAAVRYATNIGNGSAGTFAINHNLNTYDVHVTVYRNDTPREDVLCEVARNTVNQIQVYGFAIAPTVDQYRVVVTR